MQLSLGFRTKTQSQLSTELIRAWRWVLLYYLIWRPYFEEGPCVENLVLYLSFHVVYCQINMFNTITTHQTWGQVMLIAIHIFREMEEGTQYLHCHSVQSRVNEGLLGWWDLGHTVINKIVNSNRHYNNQHIFIRLWWWRHFILMKTRWCHFILQIMSRCPVLVESSFRCEEIPSIYQIMFLSKSMYLAHLLFIIWEYTATSKLF